MIAITQQQKEEWEAEVVKLKDLKIKLFETRKEYYEQHKESKFLNDFMSSNSAAYSRVKFEQDLYEELLSKAIVLPMEESWDDVPLSFWYKDGSKRIYPQGVIIKPK